MLCKHYIFHIFGCSAADSKQDPCEDNNKVFLLVAVAAFTLSLSTKRYIKVSVVVRAAKHHYYYPI